MGVRWCVDDDDDDDGVDTKVCDGGDVDAMLMMERARELVFGG